MLSPSTKQYNQDSQLTIEDIMAQYESVHSQNFQKIKRQLLRQVEQQTRDKKKQLAFYKKMVSPQNIQRLISQRRRQKQKQRQSLESRWRQCSDCYKRLQEEQKRLSNEHKQNLVDVQNLKQKIVQYQQYYNQLQRKLQNTKRDRQSKFFTEPPQHQKYQSPYRKDKSIEPNNLQYSLKMQKLNESQNVFFSQKYSLNKYKVLKSETPLKKSNGFEGFSKTSYLMNKSKIKTLATSKSQKYPQSYEREQQKQNMKEQLFKFLLNPKIKQKLYGILYRKL